MEFFCNAIFTAMLCFTQYSSNNIEYLIVLQLPCPKLFVSHYYKKILMPNFNQNVPMKPDNFLWLHNTSKRSIHHHISTITYNPIFLNIFRY